MTRHIYFILFYFLGGEGEGKGGGGCLLGGERKKGLTRKLTCQCHGGKK